MRRQVPVSTAESVPELSLVGKTVGEVQRAPAMTSAVSFRTFVLGFGLVVSNKQRRHNEIGTGIAGRPIFLFITREHCALAVIFLFLQVEDVFDEQLIAVLFACASFITTRIAVLAIFVAQLVVAVARAHAVVV